MKKIFLAFAMLIGGMVANAAEVKLAKTTFDVVEGGTVVIPIQLDLTTAEVGLYKTFQLDATLSNSNFALSSVTMASERKVAAQASQYLEQIAGKTFGIVGMKNAAVIMGESGDFLYLTIDASSATSGETCTVTFSNAKGGDVSGVETDATCNLTATINVVSYVTIDENVDYTPAAMTKDVHLIRSFEANKFYTLVLPFGLNASKLATAFGTAPTIYEFKGVAADADPIEKLTLTFESRTTLAANTPYIIKANAALTNPVFAAASIKAVTNNLSVSFDEDEYTMESVVFKGTYTPNTVVPAGALYLKSDDAKLYVSKGGTKMKGTRAYVDISALGMSFDVKNCILSLDGEETGIDALDADLKAEGWFDLNGRKLAQKPATRGVYINNGKKVVVK